MAVTKKNMMDVSNGIRSAYQKAEQVLEKGSLDYAIELLLGAVKREPGFLPARTLLRKAEKLEFSKLSPMKKILNTLKALPLIIKAQVLAPKKPMEALAAAEDALRLNVKFMPAYAALAAAGKSAEAPFIQVEAYEAIVDKDPMNEGNLRILADLYEQEGQGVKVLSIRQKIAAKYPNNLEAQAALRAAAALATMEQGSWNDNESNSVQKAKAAKASKDEIREDRIVRNEDDVKAMISVFEKKIADGSESIDDHRKLADLYFRAEEFEKSIPEYEWILNKLGAFDPTIDRLIENAKIAIADKKIQTLAEAKAPQEEIDAVKKEILLFRKGRAEERVRLYPNDTLMRFDLAVIYWELGEVNTALQHFQLAQKNPQKRLEAILYLGRCFAAKHQYDMAVEQFEKAIAEMPVMDSAKMDGLYFLGLAREKMGDEEHAMECYKQIYSADVNYADVSKKMDAYYEKKNAEREKANQNA